MKYTLGQMHSVANGGGVSMEDQRAMMEQLLDERYELLKALKVLTDRIGYYASLAEDDAPNIEKWAYTDQSSDVANARAVIEKAESIQ